TVRLTFGLLRIQPRRLRTSSMLTSNSPSSQSYQVATVMGNPSGRTQAMTAAFGRLRNSTTVGGSLRVGTHPTYSLGRCGGGGFRGGGGPLWGFFWASGPKPPQL